MKRLGSATIMLFVVAWGTLFTGCISAPTPPEAATAWTPPAEAQKPDNVWKAVRERGPDLSRPLALAELAQIAMRNSPAVRKARSDARALAAQVDQAQGYFMPTVVGVAGMNRQRISASPDTFDQNWTRFGPALQLNYLVLNFGGGREAAVEQALQTVYAADFAFNRSIQDVLLAVESAYYGLVSAQAGTEAADANVRNAKAVLDAARERKAAEVGTELEVLQAQTVYDRSLYSRAGAQGAQKIAQGILAQAIGLPADTLVQVLPPTADVPDAVAERDMRRLVDDSLQRRPDIAALRATLAAREAAVKVAGSSLWPSLYLNGSLGTERYNVAGGMKFQDSDVSYSAGISLQWTLFDGFQTASAESAARAQADSIRSQLEQVELAAGADVWIRYQNYATALEKCRFSAAFLKSASASYNLAMESYKAGLNRILDLLTAESQVAEACSQYIAAKQEAFTALANLAYATGLLEQGGAVRTEGLLSPSIRKDNKP